MMTLIKIIFVGSLWTLLSCSNQKTNQRFVPGSKQNEGTKTVKQTIFGEETIFNYSDFQDLKTNKYYDRFLIGQLKLPSGKVVCTDPIYRELGLPQSWVIEKGQYRVYIYIGHEEDFEGRIAYAELVVRDEIPKYWELSLISEQQLTDDFERKMNGMYPVENGLSCFADFEVYKKYDQEVTVYNDSDSSANYYNDKLDKLFKENKGIPNSSRGEDWINYELQNSDGNIIMFGSGYGDGLYSRYVGYDKDGNVVKFITDFIQLTATEE